MGIKTFFKNAFADMKANAKRHFTSSLFLIMLLYSPPIYLPGFCTDFSTEEILVFSQSFIFLSRNKANKNCSPYSLILFIFIL